MFFNIIKYFQINGRAMNCKTYKVLIGATGSVASLKLPQLTNNLLERNNEDLKVEIKVIVTEHSKHFFKKEELSEDIVLLEDSNEWSSWQNRGDPVLHINLGKWADLMIIAPLDANTLGKLSQGICDNLLTCTARAWDFEKPFLVCPAMNTRMWEHPVTKTQLETLKTWGIVEIPPISKTLVCGDIGVGAMATLETIIEEILSRARKNLFCYY